MPSTDTLTIYKGEDVRIDFTMDPVEDITGWTLEFNVKGAPALTDIAGVVDSGPNGTFHFDLTDDLSDSLPPGRYVYDVWRTDAGAERVLAIGAFVVLDVARSVS